MKKPSKNLGICRACPSCKKTLIKSFDLIGIGKFKIKCPHCQSLIEVEIEKKPHMKVTKLSIIED